MDCFSISILIETLNYDYIRCYHKENRGKGTQGLYALFLTTDMNVQLSQNEMCFPEKPAITPGYDSGCHRNPREM